MVIKLEQGAKAAPKVKSAPKAPSIGVTTAKSPLMQSAGFGSTANSTPKVGVSSPQALGTQALKNAGALTQQATPSYGPRIAAPTGSGMGAGGNVGTGYGGGQVAANSQGIIAETAAPPPMDIGAFDQAGYAGQDSAFAAEDSSAQSEMENLLAALARQNAEAHSGFKGNLKSLGLNFQGDDWQSGQWDPNDTLGAYGQSYQNLQNDFSGRGMMDSTFYGQSQRDLTDRFGRQRDELVNGLGQADQEYAAGKTSAEAARKAAHDRALAEAYARYSAGLV